MASVCADLQTWISGGLPDVRLIADEDLQGWQRYPDCVADQAVSAVPGEREGELLQYSPGTTGRPKGIKRALQHTSPDRAVDILAPLLAIVGITGDCVYLSPAPLYHTAPSQWSSSVQR